MLDPTSKTIPGGLTVAIPKYDELYKEILLAIEDGNAHSFEFIRDFIAKIMNINTMEQSILLASGRRPIFTDRVHWARTYLKAAGLIFFQNAVKLKSLKKERRY